MSAFRFHDPPWLLALPLIALALAWSARRARGRTLPYSSALLVADLPRSLAQTLAASLPGLLGLGLALVALALARPQLGSEEFRVRREGIAIQVALDRSDSMAALDFTLDGERVNRITAAKSVLARFVNERPDDSIGLIAFGGYAESLAPLTLDHTAYQDILKGVDLAGMAGPDAGRLAQVADPRFLQEEGATAIGDALALGVERLKDASAKSRILILLSDGQNTAGVIEPLDAARSAAAFGIKVYTIGIGSTGLVPIPERGPGGRMRVVQRPLALDEATLGEIARLTGGRYFNAKDTGALEHVYGEIDQLEKTAVEDLRYTEYRERFSMALLPGLALLALALTLQATRLRSLP